MAEKLIQLVDINKKQFLGDNILHILVNINLEIQKGEFTAIVGPSGSGKSTLMNILGCLDRPTSGEYFLNGKNVAALTDDELANVRNKQVGFVFQSFNLLPRITAQENVALPLIYAGGINEKERLERAAELLEMVGLSDRMGHRPNELSGGQKQRVAIARALINNPSIIMSDEPTGNLDSQNSHEILSIFKKMNENHITIVMVSHDPLIASYSSRLLYLKDGKIEKELFKGNKTQQEYFKEIVSINSKEMQKMLD